MPRKRAAKITQAELEMKEARAVTLRHDYGMTYEAIAKELGYAGVNGAYEAYKRGLARIVVEEPNEARLADLKRLDKAIELLMKHLENGNLKVIDPLIRVIERRSKFLGLDTPIKIQQEVTTWEGGDSIDRAIRELTALLPENTQHSQGKSSVAGNTGS